MANAFAKAAKNVEPVSSKGKADITFIDPPPEIREAIDSMVLANEKKAEAEAEVSAAKAQITPFMRDSYFADFMYEKTQPEKIVMRGNTKHAMIIAQDRAGKYNVSDEQLGAIKRILGEKKASDILIEEDEFSFDTKILYKSGVFDALGKAISECISDLVTNKKITQSEADSVLVAKKVQKVKEGLLAKMAIICSDKDEAMNLADAVGSNIVMYPLAYNPKN